MKNKLLKRSIRFYWKDTLLELFPSRALFNHNTKELLISDIHIGKGEYFQLHGIPLTNNEDESNFKRIYQLLNQLEPKELIIIGDLFHSRFSLSDNLKNKIKNLSNNFKNKIILIEGNHDRGCYLKDILFMKYKKSFNLVYSHEPLFEKGKDILNICGHYHPKTFLKNSQDKLVFSCYAMDKKNNILFLPAFGDLTGGYICNKDFKKWAIVSEELIIEI